MSGKCREHPWTSAEPTCAAGYLLPCLLAFFQDLRPGARILDVGCGNGFIAGRLAARGFAVVGIDPSARGIGIASQAYPEMRFEVLVAEGDILAQLNEHPFDAVVSTEVVEHVYDPIEYASVCFGALRPGGTFVCSTPYHGFAKNVALALANRFDSHWQPLETGGHIKFWSRRTLSRLFVQAGFVNLRFRGAGRVPLLWKSLIVRAEKPESPGCG